MNKNKLISLMSLVIMVSVFWMGNQKQFNTVSETNVQFKKCTDGDTAHFIIEGKDETVRFLAIDTPETVKPGVKVQAYGKEASNYTCNLIKKKKVRLEYDQHSSKKDKYGRILAWVFVDDELLQLKLIKKGYAKVAYLYGDYKYTGKLEEAEDIAKKHGIGLWNK